MKHYSNKSNARRAALSQGVNLDNITFVQAAEGWYWEPIELDQAMATAIAEVDTSAEDAALAKVAKVTPAEAKPMAAHYAPVCALPEGYIVATPAKQKASLNKGSGLKIEKDRAEQNGVTRPSKGGVCAQLWEMFDAMYGEKGIVPTPNPAKARSGEMGISPVTTTVQLYQWRAFMGFKGR